MADLMTRRALLAGAIVLPAWRKALGKTAEAARARLAQLEIVSGGRLGVVALNVRSGGLLSYRESERFPLCSTFKFLAAAFVLWRVDRGKEDLERRVTFTEKDLVPYSPVTKGRAGTLGMTIAELCEAAMTVSDNTAGNLLLASFGGPPALTAYARSLGDDVTRLDRVEPELNEAKPGDARDTTTPAAMAENLRKIVLGDALTQSSRERMAAWLIANKTGDKRLRAGLPKSWRIGDKTGTGQNGTANDIAVLWPADGPPIVVAAYSTGSRASDEGRNTVLATIGAIVSQSAIRRA